MQLQTEKAHAWMVFLGHQKPIITESKNLRMIDKMGFEPEKVTGRSLSNHEQRKVLCDHIKDALDKNISPNTAIFDYIKSIEEDTGKNIFLRTKKGDLMSMHTLNDLIGGVRNKDREKIPSKREIIIKLFKSGKTELQIRKLVDCRKEHVHRCLVDEGLKMKRRSPTRISGHNKRKY